MKESGARECINSWPLEAEKGKEMDFSPEAFRRKTLILEFWLQNYEDKCLLFYLFLFLFFFAKLCQDPLFLFVKTHHNTKLLAHPADTQATNACSAVEAFSSMFEKWIKIHIKQIFK